MSKQFFYYCNALMIVTSIHHVFGAYVYNTPWRLHVLAFSVPLILLNIGLKKEFQRNNAVFYLLLIINFLITISLIGLFEGVYNHLLKNILFFSGTSHKILENLFPPPKYVMPNNFIFELTGILQAIICIPLLYYFARIIKSKFYSSTNLN